MRIPGAWLVTLARWRVMRSHLPLIIATAIGTPVFYLFGLGRGLGLTIGTMGAGPAGPVPYVDYIAPALLTVAVTAVAMTEWTYPIIAGFLNSKTFHALANTPLTPRQIADGVIFSGIGRMLVVGVVYAGLAAATGHVRHAWAVPLLPLIGLAGGLAFGLLVLAFASALKREMGLLSNVMRIAYIPMTLFSATFFPLDALPGWLKWIGWISPLWHAAELGRGVAFGQVMAAGVVAWHIAYLAALIVLGWWGTQRATLVQLHGAGWFSYLPPVLERPADRALGVVWRVFERIIFPGRYAPAPESRAASFLGGSAAGDGGVGGSPRFTPGDGGDGRPRRWAGPLRVIGRNLVAMRQFAWMPILTGFFEPVLYLLSMGLGLGGFMGAVTVAAGRAVPYAAFIAPALLATSALNGAVLDSTGNVFYKLHNAKTYASMLATPLRPLDIALGEIGYALARGAVYAVGFFIVAQAFDLRLSWWAVLALPAATLVAFGVASLGLALTSYFTHYRQVEWVNFALVPMFLLSGTFFPVSELPSAVQWVVHVFPLEHAVELCRGLMLGLVGWPLVGHALYFVALAVVGPIVATRRITALFLD